MKNKYSILIISLIVLATPLFSFAELNYTRIKANIGEYVFDFGYSPEKLNIKYIASLDFNVLDKNTQDPIDFDLVWVKISSSEQVVYSDGIIANKILFGGQIKASNADANFAFFFPKTGEYEIETMFYKDDQMIGQPKFTITVQGEKSTSLVWLVGMILLLAIISVTIKRYMPK